MTDDTPTDRTPTEEPEHKAMQDHTFGRNAARLQEEAERRGTADGASDERPPEPHASGKA